MAALNRWIANAMLWFGLVLAAIGAFFGLFGGINDGLWVGVKLLLILTIAITVIAIMLSMYAMSLLDRAIPT
ncbi:MAG: hypothetical protein ACRENH_07720 [Gemmatimonadaceae bacterium]